MVEIQSRVRSMSQQFRQIPLHPLSKWNEGQMLVPFVALKATPEEIETRFGIVFDERWEQGLGRMKVARIVTEQGNDFIFSYSAGRQGTGMVVEGWAPKDPGGHVDVSIIDNAITELDLQGDEVVR